MKKFNANPATRRLLPRYCRLGAALLSLGCLLSCGGGGQDSTEGPGPVVPLIQMTVLQGAYQARPGEKEFVSFVTPDNKWYALYFLAIYPTAVVLPAIFSGRVTLGQDGAAEIPSLKIFTNSTPQLSSSSGTFSAASSQSYEFVGPSTVNGQPLPTVVASALATSADLSGTWTGTWADSKTNSTRTDGFMTFGTAAQPTAWNFFSSCPGSTLSLTPALYTQSGTGSGQTFFQATLVIPPHTFCVRSASKVDPVELTGVAFIHASPVAGKRRLDLVLVEDNGSGISFRGEQ